MFIKKQSSNEIGKVMIAVGVSEPIYYYSKRLLVPGSKLHWNNHSFTDILKLESLLHFKALSKCTRSSGDAF